MSGSCALILRRVGLIEAGAGPIIVGDEANGDVLRLFNFLRRNGYPYRNLDPANDNCAQILVERFEVTSEELRSFFAREGSCCETPAKTSSRVAWVWWARSMSTAAIAYFAKAGQPLR